MDCQYSFVIMQQIICTFCGQRNENAFFSLRYDVPARDRHPRSGWAASDAGVLVAKMREEDLAIVTKDRAHEL